MIFAGEYDASCVQTPLIIAELTFVGPVTPCVPLAVPLPPIPVPSFCAILIDWFRCLIWFPSIHVRLHGVLEDMSWIEPFWGFVHSSGTIPPFRYNGDWVSVRDDPCLVFVVPRFLEFFRSWKFHWDVLLRSGILPSFGILVPRVASLSSLGGRFAGAGFTGRVSLPLSCVQEFVLQLCAAPRVSALCFPTSVN